MSKKDGEGPCYWLEPQYANPVGTIPSYKVAAERRKTQHWVKGEWRYSHTNGCYEPALGTGVRTDHIPTLAEGGVALECIGGLIDADFA